MMVGMVQQLLQLMVLMMQVQVEQVPVVHLEVGLEVVVV